MKSALPQNDAEHWMKYDHWSQKSQCEAPLNDECHGLMKIVLPMMLDELEFLRTRVIESGYYWVHTNPEYFKLVCKYEIPTERDNATLCGWPDHEDLFDLENAEYRVYQLFEKVKKPAIKQ